MRGSTSARPLSRPGIADSQTCCCLLRYLASFLLYYLHSHLLVMVGTLNNFVLLIETHVPLMILKLILIKADLCVVREM